MARAVRRPLSTWRKAVTRRRGISDEVSVRAILAEGRPVGMHHAEDPAALDIEGAPRAARPSPHDPYRPLVGITSDLRARLPLYASDWGPCTLAAVQKIVAASLFSYICSVLPALIFGDILNRNTHGEIGIPEVLISTGLSGVLWSIFAGQGLVVVGVTGPVRRRATPRIARAPRAPTSRCAGDDLHHRPLWPLRPRRRAVRPVDGLDMRVERPDAHLPRVRGRGRIGQAGAAASQQHGFIARARRAAAGRLCPHPPTHVVHAAGDVLLWRGLRPRDLSRVRVRRSRAILPARRALRRQPRQPRPP